MFHRVKIEDQAKEQFKEQPKQPAQPQQPSFLPARDEEAARAPQENRPPRQKSFIQASETIINENKPEAKSAPAPQVKREAPVQAQPQAPVQTQVQTQQPQQKEAAPMNTNAQRDFDRNENTQDAEQAQTRPATIPGGYQAANQTRMPGGYPGAYPGYSAAGAKPASTPDARSNISTSAVLTIGRGITLSGEIESCEHLVVEGNVEAALKGAKLLDIAESGTFYGAVEIEKATIAGRFEGDLVVNGRLTIRSTGSITGSISYKELEVESGAVLEGRITALKAGQENTSRKTSGKEAATAANKARDFRASAQQDASNEEGLFADKAAAE